MRAFWLNRELMEKEANLLSLCMEAHARSSMRHNVSTIVVAEAARGSHDYTKAIIAGLATLGGAHAPLTDTWLTISGGLGAIDEAIKAGVKIPGWGSSFAKEDAEIWGPVADSIREHWPDVWARLDAITEAFKASGKELQPNPSALTVATGIALQMPPQMLAWIFIQGRLNAWTCLFMDAITKENK